jgi:hypothetical protein
MRDEEGLRRLEEGKEGEEGDGADGYGRLEGREMFGGAAMLTVSIFFGGC